MRKKIVKITLAGMLLSIGLLFIFHFRRDFFMEKMEYYTLESKVDSNSRYKLQLVSNAPYLNRNIKKELERNFWEDISLDTLLLYENYVVEFYRETKFLTRNFKEGNQYVPLYSHWDNTMDWRNHFEDRLGEISFYKRDDGSGFYIVLLYDSGWGFRMLVNIVKRDRTYQDFDDIKDFYIKKCKELGLEKTDIENDENC